MTWKPDIFSFADYRAFLRAYYESAKIHIPKFSYRAFANAAGLSSQSFLRDVMRGDKSIGTSGGLFAKAMHLSSSEQKFFDLLIDFDHANSHGDRNRIFTQIASTKRFQEARKVDEGMYLYLSNWYFPAIREMVGRKDFENNPQWISTQLSPSVGIREIKKALSILFELGLIIENENAFTIGDPTLTTGHEAKSLGVINFHHEMLRMAGESIERFSSDHRDLGAMTICVNQTQLLDIKTQIHAFRKSILHFADVNDDGDLVVQFNTQLFPLNKVHE